MDKAKFSVATLGLAAMLLASFAATGNPPQERPNVISDALGPSQSCDDYPQSAPYVQVDPSRKKVDAKPQSCSDDGGQAPDPDEPPNEEENDMSSNQGKFVAALLLAVASSGAGATDWGISVSGCHSGSPTPGVDGRTVGGQTIYEKCDLFAYEEGTPNEVCNPEITVPAAEVPEIPRNPSPDVYCSRLSNVGSGTTTVSDAVCQGGKVGVAVTRSGTSTTVIEFTKNGQSLTPQPIVIHQPPSSYSTGNLCVNPEPPKPR